MDIDLYWQCDKSLRKSLETIFGQQLYCDVLFTLPDGFIGAHQVILASRSPVFARMISKTRSYVSVSISDVEADVFKLFLRYLYTDKVDITDENFADLLYLAEKYLTDGLKKLCVEYMFQSLDINNVLYYFGLSYFYNIKSLFVETHRIIKYYLSLLLNCDVFRQLPAEAQKLIRYFFDPIYQRNEYITNTVINLPDNHFQNGKPTENFDEVFRFEQHSGKWQQDNETDAIGFETDTELHLGGVLMYGCQTEHEQENEECHVFVRVIDNNDTEILKIRTILSSPLRGNRNIYSVQFPEPVVIYPDRKYVVVTSMKVPYTYKGFHGKCQLNYGNINIYLFNTPLSTNGTTVQRGQIPGFLLQKSYT